MNGHLLMSTFERRCGLRDIVLERLVLGSLLHERHRANSAFFLATNSDKTIIITGPGTWSICSYDAQSKLRLWDPDPAEEQIHRISQISLRTYGE